jgi:oligopeptide/dipeptide ABC transporter ATP-binding protein
MPDGEPILRAENLKKYYDASEGFVDSILGRTDWVKAVDGVDVELHQGETLGVVGESGCGKTTLGRAMLRLIEPTDGSVYYRQKTGDGTREEIELTGLSSSELRSLRTDIQYIFQDPFSSLNPRLTVGDIIGEPLDIHDIATGAERTERIYELLETVGLNPGHAERYPHEFSGGQRQRIGIARALAVDPDVIVCDEPVSALDVSVQAQILNLLENLQDEFGLSYIFIAHDLSVVQHISDRIGVMYLGEFAEKGTTEEVFSPPFHPYSEALLSAIPEPDPQWKGERILLSGNVPSPINPPSGCRFHTRCPRIIQPEGFDLDQSVWRSLVDLKQRLVEAESVSHVTAVEEEQHDPSQVSRAELDELVREEFDLPTRMEPEVEQPFSEAIDALDDGDIEDAHEIFADAVRSPCEETDPELIPISGTQEISCLLYEDDYDEDQGIPGELPGSATADD